MIQIDRHIEILLLDNDCVIVPSFGGFMAHHVCAEYSTDTQSFIPPIRQICFNSQLKINDSLLAQSYIETYDISYPEAIRRIEEEVTQLKQQLQNDGYCELNDIGILRTNIEGNIEFEPCESGILTPELYGLNSVDIQLLEDLDKQNHTQQQNEEITTTLEQLTEIPQPNPQLAKSTDSSNVILPEPTMKSDAPETISIRISTLKYIATTAAVIAALFICALPFGKMSNQSQQELTKSSIDTGVLYKFLPEDKATQDKQENVLDLTDTSSKDDAAPEPTVLESENAEQAEAETKKFHSIVLASRVTKTNADVFAKSLKAKGFNDAEVVLRPNGGVKVIYGRYDTKEKAYQQLNSLREQSELFADGWVMEFNN